MTPTLKTFTLGCKVNQYETEYVRQALLEIGYADASPDQAADLCLVNSCTVTNEADAKSRQAIRRLARDNPDARIIVMGCYATRMPEEVARLPGVVEVVTDKRALPELLGRFGVSQTPTGIARFGDRHRAYLKVQDGCLLRCSYCIIPSVRPHVISRPVPEVLDEARRLLDNGYRELVLTGVHLGHYGVERNRYLPKSQWLRLSHLVRELARMTGDFRIRLSSIEATEVTRQLIDVMSEYGDKVCPHVHVCLQSGSDRILRRMRRRWSTRLFLDRCQMIRDAVPLPALTTDVIVGFPGETEADFEATLRVSREAGFSKIHIFPFSPRKGTPAAEMPDPIPKAVRIERGRALAELERSLRQDYFRQLFGRRLQVLIERESDHVPGQRWGTSCRYAPVAIEGHEGSSGQLLTCIPSAYDGRFLQAAVVV